MFFCSVSAAQRAQIAQRAICHVSPLLPTEAYQTRNLPKENRIPFNPTSFLVATPPGFQFPLFSLISSQ
jgi:hypothetical protein